MVKTKKTKTTEKVKKVETVVSKPKTKTYTFNMSISIGWVVYEKDSCILLTDEELKDFKDYVSEKKKPFVRKNPCRRC